MKHEQDQLENAMSTLRTPQWDREDHMNILERQLMNNPDQTHSAPHNRRRNSLITLIAVLIVGTGLAATYVAMNSANHYKFEVRRNGDVIGRAEVIVKRGETASVTMNDPVNTFTIDIAWDGSTTIRGMDGLGYEVEVVEIPID